MILFYKLFLWRKRAWPSRYQYLFPTTGLHLSQDRTVCALLLSQIYHKAFYYQFCFHWHHLLHFSLINANKTEKINLQTFHENISNIRFRSIKRRALHGQKPSVESNAMATPSFHRGVLKIPLHDRPKQIGVRNAPAQSARDKDVTPSTESNGVANT